MEQIEGFARGTDPGAAACILDVDFADPVFAGALRHGGLPDHADRHQACQLLFHGHDRPVWPE